VSAQVGDRVGFATQFRRAGNSLFAKALDDRLGVATLIEILKHAPTNIELLLAFTVQEEVELRGAAVAAHALAPDIAIAVDSTPARDLPAHDGRENVVYNTKLGLGPAIYIADARTLPDQRLIRHFASVGDAEKISYQSIIRKETLLKEKQAQLQSLYQCDEIIFLPVFLLNAKGAPEVALKQREGSALRYRYLRLFGTPAIHISEGFVMDYVLTVVSNIYRCALDAVLASILLIS